MKKLLIMLVALVMVVPAVWAETGSGTSLALYGSYWSPTDKDVFDQAYGGGAKIRLSFNPYVGLDLGGAYYSAKKDFMGESFTMQMIPAELALVLSLKNSSAVTPYVSAGGAYYWFTGSDVDLDSQLGYFGLVGLDFRLNSSVALFVEGKYNWLTLKDSDVKFDGIVGNVGLRFFL